MSPGPSKYSSSSGSLRSSMARDSKMRTRENTRRSPASANLEDCGRKSEREARKAKASGIQPKFTKCWESEANASLSAVAKHCIYIYVYTYVCQFFVLLPTFLFVRALFGKTPSTRTRETRLDTLVEVSTRSVHYIQPYYVYILYTRYKVICKPPTRYKVPPWGCGLPWNLGDVAS